VKVIRRGVREEERGLGTTSVKVATDHIDEERGNVEYIHIEGPDP
jgi:hypothetical protein